MWRIPRLILKAGILVGGAITPHATRQIFLSNSTKKELQNFFYSVSVLGQRLSGQTSTRTERIPTPAQGWVGSPDCGGPQHPSSRCCAAAAHGTALSPLTQLLPKERSPNFPLLKRRTAMNTGHTGMDFARMSCMHTQPGRVTESFLSFFFTSIFLFLGVYFPVC